MRSEKLIEESQKTNKNIQMYEKKSILQLFSL